VKPLRLAIPTLALALAAPMVASPASAAPVNPSPSAWIAEDGTTVTVDLNAQAVRVRGCEVDTGWISDPGMQVNGAAEGSVETAEGPLSYRVPLQGGASGEATLADMEIVSPVSTYAPDVIPEQARKLEKLAAELQAIIDASPTNGGAVTVRDLSGNFGHQQVSVNGAAPFQAASLIKLQILLEMFRQVECGFLDLDDQIWVTPADLTGGAGTLQFETGFPKHVALERLARLMITVSDNAATNLIVREIGGGDAVNALSESIGLQETLYAGRLLNPEWGWNYTSADDIAATLAVIYDGTLLTDEHNALAMEFLRGQQVAAKFKAALPEGTPLAHKTGELSNVSHDVGFILVPGAEVSVTVFTDGPRIPTGNELAQKLVRAVYDEMVAGSRSFVDVPAGAPFQTDIQWMAEQGLSLGYQVGDLTYFYPAAAVSRQAMAAFLYRYAGAGWQPAEGAQSFTDVGPEHPFHTQIEWMAAHGYATGYAGDTFGGTSPVSRQATAAFLHRLAGAPQVAPSSSFSDVDAASMFAGAITWMERSGMAGGYDDGSFGATRPVTRQAMATFLHRYDGFITAATVTQ